MARSFLSVFGSVLHAVEAATAIAAPIVRTMNPTVGGLMQMATIAAVGAESAITTPGAGAARAQAVSEQTKAAIDVANGILSAQGRAPLPASTGEVIAQQVGVVVAGLNGVASAVAPPAAASAAAGK
jgi:hypothetical protein